MPVRMRNRGDCIANLYKWEKKTGSHVCVNEKSKRLYGMSVQMGNRRYCMACLFNGKYEKMYGIFVQKGIWEAVWNVCTNWKSKRLYGMTVKMENIRDCMARLYKLDIGEMGNNGDCMACMYK